jgi:serine/threonine protein kinase
MTDDVFEGERREGANRLDLGEPPQRLLAGRFEVLRWLGEGGMGAVYLAHDKVSRRNLAVKVLLGQDADALVRFKREFRALADISHPNLIVLHELLCLEGKWLFTMEYVKGEDFLSKVAALESRDAPTLLEIEAHRLRAAEGSQFAYGKALCPVRDERSLRRVLAQLVGAMRTLHSAGKLHLDLKPSNVLVDEHEHVTVLDFGLARDLGHASHVKTQRVLGTPAYMSPEQVQGQPFDAASDWYSFGVMLYEALTGRLPFEGSIPEIMLSKCERIPLAPSDMARQVPADLESLCMALLARDPRDRPSGDEVAKRLDVSPREGHARRSMRATQDLFVGREQALNSMRDLGTIKHRRPSMLLLSGPSGVGKTTLAKHYLQSFANDENSLVLSGACYEREAMPFKAFDAVVDALLDHLTRLDQATLQAFLPRHAQALSRIFPQFEKLLRSLPTKIVPDVDDDPAAGRARAFRAFSDLIGRLSDRYRLAFFIDDLHWADLDSALLMRELFEGADPPHFLLIATYRPEEALANSFFQELAEIDKHRPGMVERVAVGTLSRAETSVLARQLLQRAGLHDETLAEHIAEESQGMPLFVQELVHHVSFARTKENRAHISLGQALTIRMARLSKEEQSLLDVLAVAGRPIPQDIAFRAAGIDPDDQSTLHALRTAGFAKSRGAGPLDTAETYHDRIREVVVEAMSAARLKQLHLALLHGLTQRAIADDEQLLAHSLGAERPARALEHAERAAVVARKALAFNRAVDHYRTALRCIDALDNSEAVQAKRFFLQEGLAESLAAAGFCIEAGEAYLRAVPLAHELQRPSLERAAADQLLRGGDLSRGIALLKTVLQRAGIAYPTGSRTTLAALTLERTRLYARGLGFNPVATIDVPTEELDALDALRVALGVYWLVEPVRGGLFATQYLRRALDAGDERHILRGLETEATYIALLGGSKAEQRAGEIYSLCAQLAKKTGSASTMGGYSFAEAGFHAIYGRKAKSTECAIAALSQPNQPGVSWERACAYFHLYQNCLYIGGRPGLFQEVEERVGEAEARRDRFAVATLLPMLSMAHLMADQPDQALINMARMGAELSPEVFGFLDVQEALWTAISHTYLGDYDAALAHYASRQGRYASSGMPRLQVWRILMTWGTMLAHLGALGLHPGEKRHRQAAMERVKHIESEGVDWPRAFAWMGRASLAHAAGKPQERDRAFKAAIVQAEHMGYHPFAAVFERAHALCTGDESARAQADAKLKSFGITNTSAWQRAFAPGFESGD